MTPIRPHGGRSHGVTPLQLDVLDTLFHAGADNPLTPMKNADIARRLDDTCGAIIGRIIALERKGLVRSGAVGLSGRRNIVVWLTDAGVEVARNTKGRAA